jgi:hypothetical protein
MFYMFFLSFLVDYGDFWLFWIFYYIFGMGLFYSWNHDFLDMFICYYSIFDSLFVFSLLPVFLLLALLLDADCYINS